MRYLSTRGGGHAVGFTNALLDALAPDGGLFSPEAWPLLDPETTRSLDGAPYAETAAIILRRFAGDVLSVEEARADCEAAYGGFTAPAVTPLRQLEPNLWLLELFHGPTLAFKDVAMQLLARLYDRLLERLDQRLTIVCATSGDTGGAAVEAFAGARRVRLVTLFPEGRISQVQRRFMTTCPDDNVRAAAVEGDFDDCQRILKALFADRSFAGEVRLSGVNSINWARIVAQSVYYVTTLAALGSHRGAAFAVPTGNFGDAFAAEAARRMGLKVKGVLVATNANDILARALQTGTYARGRLIPTQSPAMDIQVASNFERLYFELSGRDAAATRAAFESFAAGEAIQVPNGLDRDLFEGRAVSEERTSSVMREALERYGILIDPHTAVALGAAWERPASRTPLVVLSTAHPAKFPEAVKAATGQSPALPPASADLMSRPERFDRLPNDVEAVKAYVRAFA